jgi:hypothetical protein
MHLGPFESAYQPKTGLEPGGSINEAQPAVRAQVDPSTKDQRSNKTQALEVSDGAPPLQTGGCGWAGSAPPRCGRRARVV